MPTARCDRDVTIYHGTDAERIDRTHGVEIASVQCNPVPGVAIGERIGADDLFAFEHD